MKQQVDPKIAVVLGVIVIVVIGGIVFLMNKRAGSATEADTARGGTQGNQMQQFSDKMQEMRKSGRYQPNSGPQGFDPNSFKAGGSGK